MMLELFKKTVFAGIGAAVITKERIENRLQELVEQGKMTRDEAARMAEKIAADGKAEFERTRREISDNVSRMLGRDYVKRDEFRQLELRVSILEEKEAAHELNEIRKEKAEEIADEKAANQKKTPPSAEI